MSIVSRARIEQQARAAAISSLASCAHTTNPYPDTTPAGQLYLQLFSHFRSPSVSRVSRVPLLFVARSVRETPGGVAHNAARSL